MSCSKDDVKPVDKFVEEDFIGSWEHGNYREISINKIKKDTAWDAWGYYPSSNFNFEENGIIYLPLFDEECTWELEGEYLDMSCYEKAKVCLINKKRMVLLYVHKDENYIYHKYDTLIKLK